MTQEFIYNPINDKSPSGACVKGTEITYRCRVSKFSGISDVFFVWHKDGESESSLPMVKEYVDDKYINFTLSKKYEDEGFFWYHFELVGNDKRIKLIRSDSLDAVVGNANNDYLQLVITSESQVDPAFRKGIIYHIFVDRFNRNKEAKVKLRNGLRIEETWTKPVEKEYENGERVNKVCYGGNFQGIIDKLSYLKKLGVSTIYLSPIFEANSSHKYDVADYSKVDSMFGTNEDFQNLILKAKSKGIRIIIDGVFNHTGSDSVYFNKNGRYKTVGAYQSENSKYYNWYDFSRYPDEYSCWWGINTLPQTREESGFFDYIAGKNGIIEKYMSLGLGGFRLDVVDELTNNFLGAICSAVRRINPKGFIVGEVWEDASTKISYDERKKYFLGGFIDSVTNYPMKNAILDFIKYGQVQGFVNTVNLIKDQYPRNVQNNLMNILDTHDTKRALTFLGYDENDESYSAEENFFLTEDEYKRGKKLLKLATVLQYTVMGIPTVFYGDEAGIQGNADPYCRAPFPWDNIDKDLLDWYIKLGELRSNKIFDGGDMNIIYAEDGVLVYERVKGERKIVVAINRSDSEFDFTTGKTMYDFLGGNYVGGKINIKPEEGIILVV